MTCPACKGQPLKKQNENNMKDNILKYAVLALPLVLTSCSNTPPPPQPQGTASLAYQEGTPGGVIVNTVNVTATVTDINQSKRKVTLLGPDGKKFTVKVGPEAINLDQVRVGDQVKATVTEE